MALSKRANGREERLRAEATDRLIWGVMLQVEVHEKENKRSSSRRHSVSVCGNAGEKQEACTTCGRFFAAKTRDPFESGTIQSEVRRFRKSHLHVALDSWVVHLLTPHMHIQSSGMLSLPPASVFTSHSSRSKRASTASFGARQTRSYSQWCHIVDSSGVTSLWWTFSQRKITSSNKTSPRWQALSYVQVKPPSQDKKQQLYNGTVIGFLCDIKMQSTCDQML